MELHDVVKKLVGEINPIGESNHDQNAYENLKDYCDLVDEMMREIYTISLMADRHEDSISKAGKYALDHLKETAEWYEPND